MSVVFYIASDHPLPDRPNPHDRMMSVNEALLAGAEVPEFMLAPGFDRDRPEVLLVSDREVNFNLDTGIIEDGGHDDDFSIWTVEKIPQMATDKACCACFQWHRLTPGRAEQFIEYLRRQLEHTGQIELWHAWIGNDVNERFRRRTLSIRELRPEDIEAFDKLDAFTDHCWVINA